MRIGEHIEGWMSEIELAFLCETAKSMDTVVELGSYKGRSTYALCASGCRRVISIEPFHVSDIAEFNENLKEFNNLVLIPRCSFDVHKVLNSCDMLFIDANHSYDFVIRDLKLFAPKTKKMICGHDYIQEFPGVEKAVKEYFGRPPDFVVDSIWVYNL